MDDGPLRTKLSSLRRDRATGSEGATLAGLLMFGRFEALRDASPGFHVDYRKRLSDDPAVRWTNRVVPDGTWENNLFQFCVRVMQRLSGDSKMPFQLDRELYRKDDSAVYEALTQQNQRRWASYRVAEDSPQSSDDSYQLEADSPQSSPQLAGDSPYLAVSSLHLPPELLSLAEPARLKGK